MATSVLEQTRGGNCNIWPEQLEVLHFLCATAVSCTFVPQITEAFLRAAGHEEAEHLERLIVMDFRNEHKGHKERLYQNHRVRTMLNNMQDRAKKLVSCLVTPAF